MQCSQPLCDQAADRQPDHRRLFDAEMIEQRGEVGDVVGQRVRRRWRLRKSVPALVVAHDPEAACQPLRDRVPDAEIRAERVGKDQRRPVAASARIIVQDDAVEAGESHGRTLVRMIDAQPCCKGEGGSTPPCLLPIRQTQEREGKTTSAPEDRAFDRRDVVLHQVDIGRGRAVGRRQRVGIERAADLQAGLARRSARSAACW